MGYWFTGSHLNGSLVLVLCIAVYYTGTMKPLDTDRITLFPGIVGVSPDIIFVIVFCGFHC